jgi:hypothetical protein
MLQDNIRATVSGHRSCGTEDKVQTHNALPVSIRPDTTSPE